MYHSKTLYHRFLITHTLVEPYRIHTRIHSSEHPNPNTTPTLDNYI